MSFSAVTLLQFGFVPCDRSIVKAGGGGTLVGHIVVGCPLSEAGLLPPSVGSCCCSVSFSPRVFLSFKNLERT